MTTFVARTDAHAERSLRAAVALLNHVRPGWRAEVDPDRLRMDDPRACVLGQLFGRYLAGLVRLQDAARWELGTDLWLHDYAFSESFPADLWLAELAQPTPGGPA